MSAGWLQGCNATRHQLSNLVCTSDRSTLTLSCVSLRLYLCLRMCLRVCVCVWARVHFQHAKHLEEQIRELQAENASYRQQQHQQQQRHHHQEQVVCPVQLRMCL